MTWLARRDRASAPARVMADRGGAAARVCRDEYLVAFGKRVERRKTYACLRQQAGNQSRLRPVFKTASRADVSSPHIHRFAVDHGRVRR